MNIFLDIETVGHKPEIPELVLPTRDDVSIGNLKDPKKIEEKIKKELPKLQQKAIDKQKQEFDKEWRKNALNSLKSDIVCLSFAIDDNDVIGLKGTEEEIMREFSRLISSINPMTTNVVAHNGKEFDFTFLLHRGYKYRLVNVVKLFSFKSRYDPRAIDTMEKFAGTSRNWYKLDDIAKFLGVEKKIKNINKSLVHDYYLDGRIDEIVEYCNKDVEALRRVYYILIAPFNMPINYGKK